MRVNAGRLVVGLAALLVGVMIAVQFRLQQVVPPPTQTQTLLADLKKSEVRRDQLQRQIAHLRQQLDQKLSSVAAAHRLDQQLIQSEMLAGTIAVSGPGITVRWSNGSAAQGFQIADIDLLLMVNELRASGAEAIAINGQRITAESEIRSTGTYTLINSQQESAPYTIQAIGPSQTMTQALELPGGLVDQSSQEGLHIHITLSHNLTLPAAPQPLLQYSHPNPSG